MEQYLQGEVSSLIHSLVHSFVHLMNTSDDNDGDGHLLSPSFVLETMLKALPIFFFLLNLHKHPGWHIVVLSHFRDEKTEDHRT